MLHADQCQCPISSPFRWREDNTPSIFSTDRYFRPTGTDGETRSTRSSLTVDAFREEHGRCIGSIHGISEKGDKSIASMKDVRKISNIKRKERSGKERKNAKAAVRAD